MKCWSSKHEEMLADLGCESVGRPPRRPAFPHERKIRRRDGDVNLDGVPSYSVADALRARNVPFMFSTGYSGQSMKDGYRDEPVLGKPYRAAELVEILTRLIRP